MRWFHIYTSNTSITSNWGDFFANMFESYLHWHYHLHTPYLPQCPKVGHFWYRCPKCPKWGTKWGAKWGTKLDIFQKKFSLMFVRVIHLKVNLGQLMKIFIFLLGLSGGRGNFLHYLIKIIIKFELYNS